MDIDSVISDAFLGIQNPLFDGLAIFVHYGLYFAVVIAAVLILYVVKQKKEVFVMLNSLALCSLLVYGTKLIIQRERPDVIFDLPLMDEFSFPSGHTAIAFAIASTMSYFTKRRTDIVLFILAVLVGMSRIYLQAHYLTDVIAGALIGIFSSWIIRKYQKVILTWEREIQKKMKSCLR